MPCRGVRREPDRLGDRLPDLLSMLGGKGNGGGSWQLRLVRRFDGVCAPALRVCLEFFCSRFDRDIPVHGHAE